MHAHEMLLLAEDRNEQIVKGCPVLIAVGLSQIAANLLDRMIEFRTILKPELADQKIVLDRGEFGGIRASDERCVAIVDRRAEVLHDRMIGLLVVVDT